MSFSSRSNSDSLNNYNQINDLSIGYYRCCALFFSPVVSQIIIYFQSSGFWSPFIIWATPTKIDLFINFERSSFECDISLFANQIHYKIGCCVHCLNASAKHFFSNSHCMHIYFVRRWPQTTAPFLFFFSLSRVCMFYLALFSSKKLSAFSMVCAICGVQIRSPRP